MLINITLNGLCLWPPLSCCAPSVVCSESHILKHSGVIKTALLRGVHSLLGQKTILFGKVFGGTCLPPVPTCNFYCFLRYLDITIKKYRPPTRPWIWPCMFNTIHLHSYINMTSPEWNYQPFLNETLISPSTSPDFACLPDSALHQLNTVVWLCGVTN